MITYIMDGHLIPNQISCDFMSFKIYSFSGTNLFGPLGHRMGRWFASFIGLSLIGLALIFVSFITFPQLKPENHTYSVCYPNTHLYMLITFLDFYSKQFQYKPSTSLGDCNDCNDQTFPML